MLAGDNLADFPDIKIKFVEVRGAYLTPSLLLLALISHSLFILKVESSVRVPREVTVSGQRLLRPPPPLDPSVEVTEELLYQQEKSRIADIGSDLCHI